MWLDTDLRENALRCIDPEAADCAGVYTPVIYANASLHLLSGIIVWLSVARLARREIWCVVAFAFAVVNPHLWGYVGRAFSDPLAMSVSAALGHALLRTYQTRSARWSIASGVAFGALILCKAAFLFFAFSLALGFIVVGLWRSRFRTISRETVTNVLLVVGVASILVVPWMLRNFRTGRGDPSAPLGGRSCSAFPRRRTPT